MKGGLIGGRIDCEVDNKADEEIHWSHECCRVSCEWIGVVGDHS